MMRHLLAALALALCVVIPTQGVAQTGNTLGGTLLSSAARTATTVNSADVTNVAWRGGVFVVDVSSRTSGNYTVTVQGKDPVSGNYYTILSSAALAATGTTPLTVYPGIAVTANSTASTVLPRTFRVSVAGAATPVMTFSVGMTLLP